MQTIKRLYSITTNIYNNMKATIIFLALFMQAADALIPMSGVLKIPGYFLVIKSRFCPFSIIFSKKKKFDNIALTNVVK